jgi:hypothetical protein
MASTPTVARQTCTGAHNSSTTMTARTLKDPFPGAGRKGPHPQLITRTHKAHVVQHGLDKRRLRHGHGHPRLSDSPNRLCKVGASQPEQGLDGGTKVEVDC